MFRIMGFLKLGGGLALALALFYVASVASNALFTNRGLDAPAYAILEDETEAPAQEPQEELTFEDRLAAADATAGERVFKECRACHRIEEGAHAVGPSLYNVVGRAVATAEGYTYSGALDVAAEFWTPAEIDAFIAEPRAYAPGTAMTYNGLKDPQDRANVIAYLQSLGS